MVGMGGVLSCEQLFPAILNLPRGRTFLVGSVNRNRTDKGVTRNNQEFEAISKK
jgi:hypothetical protein